MVALLGLKVGEKRTRGKGGSLLLVLRLHVRERLAVLALLRVHAHSRYDDGGDGACDAEAPVDAWVHGWWGCKVRGGLL